MAGASFTLTGGVFIPIEIDVPVSNASGALTECLQYFVDLSTGLPVSSVSQLTALNGGADVWAAFGAIVGTATDTIGPVNYQMSGSIEGVSIGRGLDFSSATGTAGAGPVFVRVASP